MFAVTGSEKRAGCQSKGLDPCGVIPEGYHRIHYSTRSDKRLLVVSGLCVIYRLYTSHYKLDYNTNHY